MAYLIKSRHGIYYFRLVIPEACRSRLGKTEIRRSLGTRSKRKALVEAARCLLEAQALMVGEHGTAENACSSVVTPIQKDTPKLSEVLKEYGKAQALRGVSSKTIEDTYYQAGMLIHVIGDKNIDMYTMEDSRRFRDKALKLPPKAIQALEKNPNKTLSQLIKEASNTISITTYNAYITAITSVFEYAIDERYTERNPFKRLKVTRKVKVSSYRSEYTTEELTLIFDSIKHYRKPYQRWLPRLALYTGARLNELCQLYVSDIKIVKGIHCFHFQALRHDQRMKSVSSERLIPIHSELIKLGFLDYIDSVDKNGRVFPELTYKAASGYGNAPSRWFLDLRNKLGLENGTGKKDFHSFRHTVADMLKQQGISENLIGAILGHTTGGITNNRYGKNFKPSVLLPVIERISL